MACLLSMYKLSISDSIDSTNQDYLHNVLQQLPLWRRQQALNFKFLRGQIECAVSYLMLCNLLHERYDFDIQPHFVIGEHGKPALQERPDIHFNISHCRKAIVVAISDFPIGVDVEEIGRDNPELARHVLNDAELQQMQSAANPDTVFARLWTQKEALFKLLATGITDDIQNLLANHPDVNITTQVNAEKGYVFSIAQKSTSHTPSGLKQDKPDQGSQK